MQFQSIDYKIKMQLGLHYSLSLKSSQTNIFPLIMTSPVFENPLFMLPHLSYSVCINAGPY